MAPLTLILSSGGIRSLVATARAAAEAGPLRLIVAHLKDGRANAAARLEYARRQTRLLGIKEILEVDLAQTRSRRPANELPAPSIAATGAPGDPPLIRQRILLTALALGIDRQVGKIIWPAQCNGDYSAIARATEQMELVQHLAHAEHAQLPTLEAPLLELTDRQLIEVGGQLNLPWDLAWTCLLRGERPCRMCDACKRRRAAFDAAGMPDGEIAHVAM